MTQADSADAFQRCPMCGQVLLNDDGRCDGCGEVIRIPAEVTQRQQVGLFNWRFVIGLVAMLAFGVLTFLQLQRIRDAVLTQRTFHMLIGVALLCGVAAGFALMARGLVLAMPATDDEADESDSPV